MTGLTMVERPVPTDEPARRIECDARTALGILDDPESVEMLEALDEPKTVGELAETCGIPLSTAYRKVDAFHETGVVEQSIRLDLGGKHAAQYERSIDAITVRFDAGVECECVQRAD